MTDPINVADIPGVSQVQASAMAAVGVHLSGDLLRSDRQALVRGVAGLTVDEVRKWQSFSRLLEVRGMTPDIVRALLAGNFNTPAELAQARLSRVTAALVGVVPAPDAEATVDLMMGAQFLDLTGVVNGTVVATGDRALEGAEVQGNGMTVVSDARGRFRLTGVPVGVPMTLTIRHPEKRTKTFPGVTAHPSAALIGQGFRLTGRPAPVARLSSLSGDVLPLPGSAPITTEAQSGAPPAGDVMRLVSLYANGDGRAVSMFPDFAQGQFILRTYRLAQAVLPTGIALNDWLEQDASGKWTKTSTSRRRLGRIQRMAAVKRALTGKPRTAQLIDQAAADILVALSDPKGR